MVLAVNMPEQLRSRGRPCLEFLQLGQSHISFGYLAYRFEDAVQVDNALTSEMSGSAWAAADKIAGS